MWKKLLTFALIANIVLTAGCVTAADKKAPSAEEADTYEMLNLFGEIMERTKASYVEEVSDQKLIESAINGMLSSLDPHSSFLDAKSFQYLNEQTQGKFGGLGIEVTMESGVVKVVSPIDDTPAFKAGLKPGDYIISLDGTTVVGMIRGGHPGETVALRADMDYDRQITFGEIGAYVSRRVPWYLNVAGELAGASVPYVQNVQVWPEGDPLVLLGRQGQ